MIIYHNMMADNAKRFMGVNASQMGKSVEKLSSGLKINRAADDAAGLFISEKMRSQIRGLNQASANALDGISAVQTAEGALDEVHSMLQRMRELSVKAGNDTLQTSDKTAIAHEMHQLTEEIDNIGQRTQFNKQVLLDGKFTGKVLQTGANEGQTTDITIDKMTAEGLGLSKAKDYKADQSKLVLVEKSITADGKSNEAVTDEQVKNANATAKDIVTLDKAIKKVSEQRSRLGAVQNRLEHTIKNLDNAAENTQAAESRVRDTDMAKEMSKFTKDNILTQAAQAMLAQANQLPQQVLALLR